MRVIWPGWQKIQPPKNGGIYANLVRSQYLHEMKVSGGLPWKRFFIAIEDNICLKHCFIYIPVIS
jgi:hypothetical protein